MEREKLSALLHILPDNAVGRTAECPDNYALAAIIDGRSSVAEHEQTALHLADCDFCLSQIGLMKRLQESAVEPAPGEFVLARARRLGKQNVRPAIRNTVRWASAAVIVLAILMISRLNPLDVRDLDTTAESTVSATPEALDLRQTRNRSPAQSGLRVLTPADGATIDAGKLVFAWTDIPGSLYYDVRIVTEGGDLVWQTRVEDTRLEVPASLQLEPNTDYFFRVDAHLASAKDISSQHILFSTRESY